MKVWKYWPGQLFCFSVEGRSDKSIVLCALFGKGGLKFCDMNSISVVQYRQSTVLCALFEKLFPGSCPFS
jgi:hypothetical protein